MTEYEEKILWNAVHQLADAHFWSCSEDDCKTCEMAHAVENVRNQKYRFWYEGDDD